jgi:transcription elongation factor GreB
MSRYRPPQRQGSRYITAEGMATLRAELHQLWKIERPQVTATVHEAAKNGDRSENGDYIYGKRRLREIDSRVRFLTKRIDSLEVVDQLPADRERIFFGAWVTVEDEDGANHTYRIVGPDEFDLSQNKLSRIRRWRVPCSASASTTTSYSTAPPANASCISPPSPMPLPAESVLPPESARAPSIVRRTKSHR